MKYQINETILNIIHKFSDLHGKLYGVMNLIDDDIREELIEITSERAAFTSITHDIDSMKSLSKILEKNQIVKNIPDKDVSRYSSYLKILNKFETYFAGDDFTIDKDLMEKLHDELGLPPKSKWRTDEKNIDAKLIQDGIKYTYQTKVRTHPKSIDKDLKQFFIWFERHKDTNPIILAALVYISMAEIHPFKDGNGRISKLLSRGILYRNGIDQKIILSIDDFFLINQKYYFELIEKSILSKDLTDWIEFYSRALLHSIIYSADLLKELSCGAIDIVNDRFIKLKENERNVLQLIKENKNMSGAEVGRELDMSRQNANNILHSLIDKDLISQKGKNTGVRFIYASE